MRTALTHWGRSQASAPTSTLVIHRPDQINWVRVALQFALGILLMGNLLAPFAARAQNLGTSPQFGQAVQGQQATTVEGMFALTQLVAMALHMGGVVSEIYPGSAWIRKFIAAIAALSVSGIMRLAESMVTQAHGVGG